MAFCYECGSEVAPHDIFCPYCGIALPPVAAPEPPTENHAEPTAPPVPTTHEQSGESVAAPEIEPENQNLTDTANEKAAFEKDLTEFAENLSNADEPFIPAAAPTSFDPTANNAADASVSSTVENAAPVSFEASFADLNNLTDENSQIKTDAKSAESADILGETEDLEKADFDNLKKSNRDDAPPNVAESDAAPLKLPADDADFTATIPYVPANSGKISTQDELLAEVEKIRSAEDEKVSAPLPPIEIGNEPENREKSAGDFLFIEPPIVKPADDLSSHISDPPNSQFDSVRIMEPAIPAQEPKIQEISPFTEIPAIENLPPAAQTVPVEIAAEKPRQTNESNDSGNAPKSSTSPNIGGSESDNKKAAKLKPLDEGTILNNRYEIIRKIGGGGMGAVYLASDNNLGGVLRAVKEMVQSYIEESQQDKAINDFKRESMILSTLDHVSIPTIYDYFYDERESRFYLVMKYISGGDLSAKLRSTPAGKIDEKSVTEWGIQVADVLDYLHNRPTTIVYRDLKPANLMIDGNSGRIMLIDFGIARSVTKEEKGVTAVGTMGYAPPELFSGNVEPRSDIYSLGSTMFHLLTGADPQSNPLLIFDFQKNPRPRQINSQLSDQMERILMRAVEYNADARFKSAAELRQVLQEHLENLKIGSVTFGIKEAPKSVSLENQPVFCGFCGQRIMATDMFCAFCGAKQPLSQRGVHSEIYASSTVSAKVMIVGTNELDSPVFDLDKDVNLVGRRDPQSNIFPEVDLSKYDPQTKISRRHALIKSNGGTFTVEDLGSSNGTMIIPAAKDSLRLLPHQPHVLTDGDRIRVGDTTLNFFLR